MKEVYKNPILYYVAVPALVALWPVVICFVYLPNAEKTLGDEMKSYSEAQRKMAGILLLDPGRLDSGDPNAGGADFNYLVEVEKMARLCEIPAANYSFGSRPPRDPSGQKSQIANVELKDIDITRFARFLSTLQLRWANLQCEKVSLEKKKGRPDKWDVDLGFKYYY